MMTRWVMVKMINANSTEERVREDRTRKRRLFLSIRTNQLFTFHIDTLVMNRKEEKLSVINMRDRGMTYEDIAKQTGYSRVNMEKWCSVKVRLTALTTV